MLVDVVCMRHQGERRRDEDLLADQPTRGQLTLQGSKGRNQYGEMSLTLRATLVVDGREVLDPLVAARVTRIEAGSLMIVGIEVHTPRQPGTTTQRPQTWWCRLVK